MDKQHVSGFLRKFRLLKFFDFIRFYFYQISNRKKNHEFLTRNPGVKLPPDYLMYESFQLDYTKYYNDSYETAVKMADVFKKNIDLNNVKILDWGCGPGRIIRHLPGILEQFRCDFLGTDYNAHTIRWCKENLPGIEFSQNNLRPPLPFDNEMFDVIYGISIFTHLSERMHYDWFKELDRILKSGGIIYQTTQGSAFRGKLLKKELEKFDQGRLVVRGNVKEGHRMFSAFQPPKFMKDLFVSYELVEFIEGDDSAKPQQDIWIFRKTVV